MPNLAVINFSSDIDPYLQVGDIIYYSSNTSSSGGFEVNKLEQDILKIGDLHTIINKSKYNRKRKFTFNWQLCFF